MHANEHDENREVNYRSTLNLSNVNRAALIESMLLAGAAAVLLIKALDGTLVFYIHPSYIPLVVICGGVLLLMAVAHLLTGLRRPPQSLRGRASGYALLALPIAIGLFVPARPLGSGTLGNAALGVAQLSNVEISGQEDTQRWNLLQWAAALDLQNIPLAGREADVVGFVYHDPLRTIDGFFIARYVIAHCVADTNAVRLPVVWPDGQALPVDAWVRVRGQLDTLALGDRIEPALIATSIEVVSRPADPYLYP